MEGISKRIRYPWEGQSIKPVIGAIRNYFYLPLDSNKHKQDQREGHIILIKFTCGEKRIRHINNYWQQYDSNPLNIHNTKIVIFRYFVK